MQGYQSGPYSGLHSQINISDGSVFCDKSSNVIWTAECSKFYQFVSGTEKQSETNVKNAFKAKSIDVCLSHWFSVVHAVL